MLELKLEHAFYLFLSEQLIVITLMKDKRNNVSNFITSLKLNQPFYNQTLLIWTFMNRKKERRS